MRRTIKKIKDIINNATLGEGIQLIALLTTVVALFYSFFINKTSDFLMSSTDRQLLEIHNRIDKSYNDIGELRQVVSELKHNQTYGLTPRLSESESDARLKQLDLSFDSLQKKFHKIESIIVRSPNDALEIPLLKKDIDTFKLLNDSKIEALNKDIERSYNIILVTIVSLAVAIFAPILSSLFSKTKSSPK